MAAITEWVRRIMAYLIFTSTISNILREQSYQKYVRLVCGIILIFLLAEPIFFVLDKGDSYQFHLEKYHLLNQAYDTATIEEAGTRKEEFLFLELKKSMEGELAKIAGRYGLELSKASLDLCGDSESKDYGRVQSMELVLKNKDSIYRSEFDSPDVIQLRNEIAESFHLSVQEITLTVR